MFRNWFRKIFGVVVLFLVLFGPIRSSAYYDLGQPQGFINDYAGVLSGSQKIELEANLVQFAKNTTHEVVVVTIKSLEGDTVENFAVKLFAAWGIGKKEADNGVLFLIALDDRQMRIEVGYGLEGALTDLESYYILEDVVKPQFKNSAYAEGIVAGVEALKQATVEEIVPVGFSKKENSSSGNFLEQFFPILLALGWIIIGGLLNYFAKTKSYWLGGVLGGIFGVIIGVIATSVLVGIILTIFIGGVGLGLDYLVSKRGLRGQDDNDHWWFFPGGRGGGGSSGFGGLGGGGSGGGGSSSSW